MANPTHEVGNQPPPLVDWNLFDADPVLPEALAREGAGWAAELAREVGALAGSEEATVLGAQANANPPCGPAPRAGPALGAEADRHHLRPGAAAPRREGRRALCGMAMTEKQDGRRETFSEFTA
jgi:Adaptive response protein AidB N-terminal domain